MVHLHHLLQEPGGQQPQHCKCSKKKRKRKEEEDDGKDDDWSLEEESREKVKEKGRSTLQSENSLISWLLAQPPLITYNFKP